MFKLASGVFVLIGLSSAAWSGPISAYYLTNGDGGTNWVVQGAAVVNTWAQAHPEEGGEYAIAVNSTVRTLGNGNQGSGGASHVGSEYTLGGVFTGTTYPYPGPPLAFYDGTTDGTHNYSVDYSNGGVYQMNADWSNAVLLFGTASNDLGITYDPTNSSLWVSSFNSGDVSNYSLAGTLLSSFNTGIGSMSSLALDHADGTLWFGSQNTQGTFYQYSKAGALLSTEAYAALIPQNTLGGEFALGATVVPEPGAFVLFGAGLAAIALFRRR